MEHSRRRGSTSSSPTSSSSSSEEDTNPRGHERRSRVPRDSEYEVTEARGRGTKSRSDSSRGKRSRDDRKLSEKITKLRKNSSDDMREAKAEDRSQERRRRHDIHEEGKALDLDRNKDIHNTRRRHSRHGHGNEEGMGKYIERRRERGMHDNKEEDADGNKLPEGKDIDYREKDREHSKEGKYNGARGREFHREESRTDDIPKVEDSSKGELFLGRTGGIYIPPHRKAQMMRSMQDKSSEAYQRLSWDALRKSINGLVNKVNAPNIKNIIPELFSENLIRGRGLFCRSCMKQQMASPRFTDVLAALVAVVNTKFPEVGKLLLKRIVLQLKRAYKRNDKPQLLAATNFIAHLVNQQVAHEIIALELLSLLLENPSEDSVEVAVGFVKECGSLLQDFSPRGLDGIFSAFRGILHEGDIYRRVQFLIEGLFAIRKAKFQGFPAIRPELDLVEEGDQLTHEISLLEVINPETGLDVFKFNPRFLDDEKEYEDLKKSILGDESSEDEEDSDAAAEAEEDEESEDDEDADMQIKDETETNLVNLRRTIYLTIMSSVDFEEAGHKLLKIKLEPGQEMELCIMLLECCSQERTYLRYYGLLGQRFCLINKVHQENFEKCFVHQYSMIHRLETNKLRNVAKFFAHLLGTNALPWHVLSYIRLTEEDTTSSSRIFIKILFQELSEQLGIRLLNEYLNDPSMQDSFESIFPRDNPKNTRFSINFFTSIGLGGITENIREYLKNMPRLIMQQQKPVSDSSDDESGSSSESSPSDSGSSSSSDKGDGGKRHRKRR